MIGHFGMRKMVLKIFCSLLWNMQSRVVGKQLVLLVVCLSHHVYFFYLKESLQPLNISIMYSCMDTLKNSCFPIYRLEDDTVMITAGNPR